MKEVLLRGFGSRERETPGALDCTETTHPVSSPRETLTAGQRNDDAEAWEFFVFGPTTSVTAPERTPTLRECPGDRSRVPSPLVVPLCDSTGTEFVFIIYPRTLSFPYRNTEGPSKH